ncbi:MAG: ankyrin repeat domain-containing protein [Candidatus Riflebacteria bacterium]|nr:ankyrin repeat domain-containing protein [Candidatus Riflebacteria bacterium]
MKNNRMNLFSAVFAVVFIFVILLTVHAACVEEYDPFEDDFGEEEFEEVAPMKDSDYQDSKISKRRLLEIIERPMFKNFDKKNKAKEMIENGLLIDISSKREETLLCEFAGRGRFKEVKLLLELGANPNYLNETSESVLENAVRNCSTNDDSIDTIHLLIRNGADIHNNAMRGLTPPLMWTPPRKDLLIQQILLSYGADVNEKSSNGQTPLMYAAGKTNLFKLYLRSGGDVNARDNEGNTVLCHIAKEGKSAELVALAIKHGSDPMEPNNKGEIPLVIAAKENPSTEVFSALVKLTPGIEKKNGYGGMALVELIRDGTSRDNCVEKAELLIKYGADITYADKDSYSIVKLLRETKERKVNEKSFFRTTPEEEAKKRQKLQEQFDGILKLLKARNMQLKRGNAETLSNKAETYESMLPKDDIIEGEKVFQVKNDDYYKIERENIVLSESALRRSAKERKDCANAIAELTRMVKKKNAESVSAIIGFNYFYGQEFITEDGDKIKMPGAPSMICSYYCDTPLNEADSKIYCIAHGFSEGRNVKRKILEAPAFKYVGLVQKPAEKKAKAPVIKKKFGEYKQSRLFSAGRPDSELRKSISLLSVSEDLRSAVLVVSGQKYTLIKGRTINRKIALLAIRPDEVDIFIDEEQRQYTVPLENGEM